MLLVGHGKFINVRMDKTGELLFFSKGAHHYDGLDGFALEDYLVE
jgi:hypothetical protein